MHTYTKGFTLIEAVVVVALIGIMAAIALPRYGPGVVSKYRLKNSARRIVSDLRFSRGLAISTRVDHILEVYPGSCQYRIYRGSISPANQVDETRELAASVVLGGDTIFTFGPQGNAVSGSGTNITLSEGGYIWRITVTTVTGRTGMAEEALP